MSSGSGQRALVLAFDLGTTNSAIAFAQTARPEVQSTIVQWSDAFSGTMEGITSDKVPTELKFDGTSCRWGFQIHEDETRHRWFKLGIDPQTAQTASKLAIKYPDDKALPPAYDSGPEMFVTEFLSQLYKHALKVLEHKVGRGVITSTPIACIVTVPPFWSEVGKDRTRRCAIAAGLGENVRMITEPEAAAIHALDMMDPHGLQKGDAFLVCDAGGGTVDLITYVIRALSPQLELDETTKGSGDLCGSTFLNRSFATYMKDKFGGERGWNDETLEEAMDKFEKVTKRSYGGSQNDSYMLPVSGLRDIPSKNVSRGKFRMPGKDLERIFDEVVDEAIALLSEQIFRSPIRPKTIMRVGGFGQSPYLRKSIRNAFPDVEVMQPANGWTAVVRGALVRGLADQDPAQARTIVGLRKARDFRGVTIDTPYQPGVHRKGDKSVSIDTVIRLSCSL